VDEINKGDALIRFFNQDDPEQLTDEEWTSRVAGIQYVLDTLLTTIFGKQKKSQQ
jgi:hypothetical protein